MMIPRAWIGPWILGQDANVWEGTNAVTIWSKERQIILVVATETSRMSVSMRVESTFQRMSSSKENVAIDFVVLAVIVSVFADDSLFICSGSRFLKSKKRGVD